MESEAEENFVDVPESPTEVLELPIRVTREQPGNDPRSWADRVAGRIPQRTTRKIHVPIASTL